MQSNIIYDDANRRIETKSDLNALNDNLVKAESFYDGLGRTIEARKYESDGGYVASQTQYDALGRPHKQSNPFRPSEINASNPILWTQSYFDALGRATKVKTPDNAEVNTSYSGNTVTVTDQAGKQRRSVTNALGQLVRVDEPNDAGQLGSVTAPNQPTSYAYDTLNNLTTVSQGVQTRTFAYNSLSRLTSATNPESGTINNVYDNNGNLTSKTDARGVKTDYIYDALNRVTNRNYSTPNGTPGTGILANYQPSPNVTYFYDGANVAGGIANSKGKLTKVSSSVSTTEYMAFDILGRVTRSKQTTDGVEYGGGTDPTKWMTYTYNLSGALIEQQYPSGRAVRNTLDNDGSLSIVQSSKSNVQGLRLYANAFTYTAAGAVSAMRLGNGKWETTQFNSRLQPKQIGLGTSATNQGLLKLNYDYGTTDNNGNIKSQIINTGSATFTQTYLYDSLNRLIEAKELNASNQQTWKQNFGYDRFGNRTPFSETILNPDNTTTTNNQTPQVDASNNRFTTASGFVYDLSGNVITDNQGRTFNYEGENKQTSVAGSNGMIGTYLYDGDGKRVKKVVPNGETTIFVYDASGKMVAEYSTIVASTQDAQVSYLTNDHLGSPRITTDAVGQVISRRDFRPFGEEISRANYGSDSVREKFATYERDSETELDFAQARMYFFTLGRFGIPDPENIGSDERIPQSWNGYVYVGNNPPSVTDPTGLIWMRNGNELHWMDDDVYNKFKDTDEFKAKYGSYEVLAYDSVVTLAEGQTGQFAGLDGQQIRLGRNRQWDPIMPEGVDPVTVVADQGPIELNPFQQVAHGFEHQGAMWFWRPVIYGAGTAEMAALSLATAAPLVAGTGAGSGAGGAGATSNSIIGNAITGFTKHGINSAISHNGVGVSTRAILNTLKNPIKVVAQSEGRLKVVGKDAVVILNRAGEVITTWARNSGATRVQ